MDPNQRMQRMQMRTKPLPLTHLSISQYASLLAVLWPSWSWSLARNDRGEFINGDLLDKSSFARKSLGRLTIQYHESGYSDCQDENGWKVCICDPNGRPVYYSTVNRATPVQAMLECCDIPGGKLGVAVESDFVKKIKSIDKLCREGKGFDWYGKTPFTITDRHAKIFLIMDINETATNDGLRFTICPWDDDDDSTACCDADGFLTLVEAVRHDVAEKKRKQSESESGAKIARDRRAIASILAGAGNQETVATETPDPAFAFEPIPEPPWAQTVCQLKTDPVVEALDRVSSELKAVNDAILRTQLEQNDLIKKLIKIQDEALAKLNEIRNKW